MEGPEKLTARSEHLAGALLDTLAVPSSPVDRPVDEAATRRSKDLLKGLYARTGQQETAGPAVVNSPKVTSGDPSFPEMHAPKATGAEVPPIFGATVREPIYVVAGS